MTYAEQLQTIKEIPMREGDQKVITCPFCNGSKKLSISKNDGLLKWYCFRASCNARGIHSGRRNLQSTKNYLSGNVQSKEKYIRPIPSITTSVYNHPPALEFLSQVNSLEAVELGYIKVRYCPSEDRVLFYNDNGAVGRSLSGSIPKWVSFGTIQSGFHVGEGTTAVLVEDVPSACSVSRVKGLVGVALLGTTLSYNIKKALIKYDSKYLCLDKDAAKLSIRCRKTNEGLKVRFTSADLKHLTVNQIQFLLFGI